MGEKIVKKIRGMSWTTKISLMLISTLMVSIFMYQGWYKPRETQAAVPTFVAAGAVASAVAAITPALPAGIATNDILLLFLNTSNEAITIPTPAGGTWTEVLPSSPQGTGTAATVGSARLTVFWSRYNGTQLAPTTSDSGDHQIGVILAFRGVITTGNPWDVTAGGVEALADFNGAIPGATTTVADTLVVAAIATGLPDANTAIEFSGWANAALTSVTEQFDVTRNQGFGGGLGIATGTKAIAGAYGNTAVNEATSAVKGMMSIALKPEPNAAPTLSISQPPAGNTTVRQGSSYSITYTLADTDNVVTAAFYYDTDAVGLNGTAITGACATAPEGTGVTCAWDTTGVTPGAYYVYGITNDGVNPQVSAYSAGTLTVNAAPTISISQPDGVGDTVTVGANYSITYTLADSDDVVTAAFYYDTDAVGLNGTAITGACATAPEGSGVTCSWDTTGMTPGSYYVYGITNDGRGAVSAYSPGMITINAANAAPTISISQPDGTGDTVTVGQNYSITYTLADSDDVVTAAFYYDTDAVGLNGTAITGACATAPEGSGVTCSWDTTGMTPGSYYVYGITNDGVNPQVSAYSSGMITINAVCTRNLPTLDLSPNSQTITTDGGSAVYTLTITNNDTAACASETFDLSKTDTNSTNFNASVLSQPSVILAPGATNNTITLTVSAKAGETSGSNNTYVTADDVSNTHANQNSDTVTTTINIVNMLMHNSVVISSTKWAPNGWGIAGGKYGEFTCGTCHVPRATNIKGVRSTVTAPADTFPGSAVNFQSTTTPNGFGDDSGNSPRLSSTKVCEVCHTYDVTKANGVNTHPYSVVAALSNHYSADNTDCTSCHKHNVGFKGMGCDSCHGNPPTVNTLGGPNGLANDPGATGSQTAGSHNMHANTLSYVCATCHTNYTMPDPSQDIDIGFSMFGKDGTGTTYNGQAVVLSYTGKNNTIVTKTGSAGGNNLNCSGLYCHGSTLTAGTLTSPWWDGTGTVTCGTCHGKDAATPPTKINHPRHAGSGAGGLSVACTDCHSATAGAQGHVNGDVSWSLNTGSSKFGVGAQYRGAASGSTGGTAPSASYGTCSSVYCHSNVQNGLGTAGPTSYGTPTWGAAGPLTCSTASCHGNAPATPTANNAHGTHTTGNYLFACSACHNNGGDESANHANGTLNMTISATYGGSYSQSDHTPGSGGYGTCATVYCHGNYAGSGGASLTPSWAGAVACGDCHKYLNTNPPTPGSHGRHAGQAAGQLNLACAKCHEPARVLGDGHVNLSVQWDLDRTDTKIGSTATYKGTELGATGLKAPSAAYGNCGSVYCHSSVQSGNGTGAPLSYDAPTWGVASVTCDSCHGQGAGVNDGSPSTGSHPVHVATYAYTCAVCHTGHGKDTATHANRTINLAFDAATAGGSAAYTGDNVPQSGAFGNCTTTFCHGDSSNTSAEVGNWGTSLSASDACTVCHGTKTAGVDGSAAAINRAPGGNATGVDTNGTLGTIVRNVSNDTEVGAHDGHLRGVALISNAIACTECHAVPAVTVAGIKGHLGALPADMTFGTIAKTNGAIPSFDPSTHTCSNVYCHNETKFSTTQHTNAGTGWAPVWNNQAYFGDNLPPLTSTECGRCHFYDLSNCASCHPHVAAGNLSFADKTLHIDGLVQGAGDCVGCHANAQDNLDGAPTRRAMTTEFGLAWGHKKSGRGAVTKYDCGVCHMEGDPVTGAWTALHKDNKLDFRDPDTGVTIKGVTFAGTPGSYTSTAVDATAAAFSRNTNSNTLEAFAQAVQVNLCLKCHDSNGANSASARVSGGTAANPWNDGATVLNVSTHFATGNASYHPVSGKQNNSYCNAITMLAPWNYTKTPGNNTSYGYLMTCWDCHDSSATARTIGGAIASVTAHGNAVTLRASYNYNPSAGSITAGPTGLCVLCHNTTVYYAGGAELNSAFGGGVNDDHKRHGSTSIGAVCGTCHGSSWTDPGRPTRAEDAHGFDKLVEGTWWPVGAGNTNPPYSFLRNTTDKDAGTTWTDFKPPQLADTNDDEGCYWGANAGSLCSESRHDGYNAGGVADVPYWTDYGPGGRY